MSSRARLIFAGTPASLLAPLMPMAVPTTHSTSRSFQYGSTTSRGNFLRPSGWSKACGEDFIAQAFIHAHAADPKALLVYNDYNNELPAKRAKQVRLIKSLRERGAPLHAIGLQGHYEIDKVPFADIEATLIEMRALGVKVVVSELDIDVIPRARWWADGGKYRDELSKLDPYRDGSWKHLVWNAILILRGHGIVLTKYFPRMDSWIY